MPVMATRLAKTIPTTAPMLRARMMRIAVVSTPRPGSEVRARPTAAATATTMPHAPAMLPATAVSCLDSPVAAMMNKIAARM